MAGIIPDGGGYGHGGFASGAVGGRADAEGEVVSAGGGAYLGDSAGEWKSTSKRHHTIYHRRGNGGGGDRAEVA